MTNYHQKTVRSDHASADLGRCGLRLIDWHSHIHHAHADAVEEAPDEQHCNVRRTNLNNGRHYA